MSAKEIGRGRFISLEGGEGVGKSTQVRALAQALRELGIEVVETREPGGSAGAEKIRELLLDPNEDWSAQSEALLFAAARADHVEKVIKPALAAGKWVISDRFVDSSLAYQGGAGGLGYDHVWALHKLGSDAFLPDRTFVLTLGPKGVEKGVDRETGGRDRIGARPLDFHYEVFLAFQHIYQADEGSRVFLVDGSQLPSAVTNTLMQGMEDILP